MSERGVTESVVEEAALAWLEATGWRVANGPDIAPDSWPPNGATTARWCWSSACTTHWPG